MAAGLQSWLTCFSKAKRSEVMLRIRGRESEPAEIAFIPRDAEVFNDVRDDAARHIARMPSESDQAVGTKRIRVMPVAEDGLHLTLDPSPHPMRRGAAADLTQAAVKLSAVPRGVFAHGSGGENRFVAESRRNGASSFEQRFQMDLGGLLKTKHGFAPVASVGVTAGQERGSGDPDAVFILTDLHFRERNDHNATTIAPACFRRNEGV
jgi:hypothetical protein